MTRTSKWNFVSDLYAMGVIIAYKMLQYGIEKREVAIVGRLTKFSCASFVSYKSSYSVGHINDVIARH